MGLREDDYPQGFSKLCVERVFEAAVCNHLQRTKQQPQDL